MADIFDQAAAQPQKQDIFDQIAPTGTPQPSGLPPIQSGMAAAAMATGLRADTRSWAGKKWDEIKTGLAGAQPGSGLPQQPTALGSAAQFVGMGASQIADLAGPVEGGAQVGTQLSKLLPAARMERAGQALNEVSAAVGKHTVPISEGLSKATMYAKQIMESGGGKIQVINDFLKRMTNPELGPLTFDEGREFLKSASKLSIKDIQSMKGSMGGAVKQFASELSNSLTEVAAKAGQSEQYLKAMKDYGSAAQTAATAKAVGKAWEQAKDKFPWIVGGTAAAKYLQSK